MSRPCIGQQWKSNNWEIAEKEPERERGQWEKTRTWERKRTRERKKEGERERQKNIPVWWKKVKRCFSFFYFIVWMNTTNIAINTLLLSFHDLLELGLGLYFYSNIQGFLFWFYIYSLYNIIDSCPYVILFNLLLNLIFHMHYL